jgi:O-acetyl-ADP-ribose deacetylase (regulator of RNase III)
MFTEITGDVFDPAHGFDAVGHGVNLKGVMGAGIAKTVSTRYPAIMEPYRQACSSGELALGGHQTWEAPDGLLIVNLATQDDLGRDARLWAVADSVRSALDDLEVRGARRFGVPQLGCGIGGLDWPRVRACLRDLAVGHPVELVAVTWEPSGAS